jgi:hypothetical protein
LRLEEFIDDIRHGMALQLEPQGLLFAEVIILIMHDARAYSVFWLPFIAFSYVSAAQQIYDLCSQVIFLATVI